MRIMDRNDVLQKKRSEADLSLNEVDNRLYDFFTNHGFGDYSHERRRQLAQFCITLLQHQKKQNLTRLTKISEIAIKHFIDCLMIARLTTLRFPLLDVGSGAGFPGIPLKIEFPDKPMILAEGVQKRVQFLKEVRKVLGLKSLDIVGRKIDAQFNYPVDGVITRAVEEISTTLGRVLGSLRLGGEVYLMKGPNCTAEIDHANKAWKNHFALKEEICYHLPETQHERRLVIYTRIQEGPSSAES